MGKAPFSRAVPAWVPSTTPARRRWASEALPHARGQDLSGPRHGTIQDAHQPLSAAWPCGPWPTRKLGPVPGARGSGNRHPASIPPPPTACPKGCRFRPPGHLPPRAPPAPPRGRAALKTRCTATPIAATGGGGNVVNGQINQETKQALTLYLIEQFTPIFQCTWALSPATLRGVCTHTITSWVPAR